MTFLRNYLKETQKNQRLTQVRKYFFITLFYEDFCFPSFSMERISHIVNSSNLDNSNIMIKGKADIYTAHSNKPWFNLDRITSGREYT